MTYSGFIRFVNLQLTSDPLADSVEPRIAAQTASDRSSGLYGLPGVLPVGPTHYPSDQRAGNSERWAGTFRVPILNTMPVFFNYPSQHPTNRPDVGCSLQFRPVIRSEHRTHHCLTLLLDGELSPYGGGWASPTTHCTRQW